MDYQIITGYGNGEMIKGILDALAMCINSQTGSMYTPLVRLGIGIGAIWALAYTLWGDHMRMFATWFLPVFMINSFLFVPSVTVWVKDPLIRMPLKVDHVPFGLAMCASLMSKLGAGMTQEVEKVFSLPDDLKYQKSGCMFASNLILKTKTMRIVNEDVASNMREFCTQCIMYDAMLGRKYTLRDLRHTDDIWKLVSERPSPVRSFVWRSPRQEGQPGPQGNCMRI